MCELSFKLCALKFKLRVLGFKLRIVREWGSGFVRGDQQVTG